MIDKVFLEKIKFKEDFPPFKEWTEIDFNNKIQDIIKFYLGSKEGFNSTKAENVAERMKINVIVGENGTGKSKLFDIIDCKKGIKDECKNKSINEINLNNVKINLQDKEIIIDNPTIFENININDNFYDLFFWTSYKENELFWKEILESFFRIQLNILNYSILLDIDQDIDFYINYKNIDKGINKYEWYITNILNIINRIDATNSSIVDYGKYEILNWLIYILVEIGKEYTDSIYKAIKSNSVISINTIKKFIKIISLIVNIKNRHMRVWIFNQKATTQSYSNIWLILMRK